MNGFFSPSLFRAKAPEAGLIPKCGVCGLFKNCHTPKMEPLGRGRKKILVVGECPTEQEDDEGRPFLGKGGALLRDTLRAIGSDLDQDAISTNALICAPGGVEVKDKKQINYCQPNLLNTIREVQPTVVVTLGHSALKSVLRGIWKDKVGPLERWVGWKIPWRDFWICPTYHPSYLLQSHDQILDRQFSQHLETAFAIAERSADYCESDLESQVEVIYDEAEVEGTLMDFDRAGGWHAFDYESNCLKPEYEKAKLYCCSVSNGERTIAYPWTPRNREATYYFLKSDRTRKIAANIKNEERWSLVEFGEGVTGWGWDTMLGAHCLDNREMTKALKFQLFVQFGVETYNAHIDPFLEGWKGRYNRIQMIDPRQLLTYCGIDSLGEFKLAMRQRKAMGYAD